MILLSNLRCRARTRRREHTGDKIAYWAGPGQTVPMAPPAEDRAERPFGTVGIEQFTLDLRPSAPSP